MGRQEEQVQQVLSDQSDNQDCQAQVETMDKLDRLVHLALKDLQVKMEIADSQGHQVLEVSQVKLAV